jgi:hypothetical protein
MNSHSDFMMRVSGWLLCRRPFVLLLVALTLVGCTAPESKEASVWKLYAQSDDYQFFYDSRNIESGAGDIVKILLKRQPKEEFAIIPETKRSIIREMKKRQKAGMTIHGYENWDHEVVVCEIDCRKNVIRFLKSINYDQKGNALDTIVVPEAVLKWDNVIPGTINDNLRKSICSGEARQESGGWLKRMISTISKMQS